METHHLILTSSFFFDPGRNIVGDGAVKEEGAVKRSPATALR